MDFTRISEISVQVVLKYAHSLTPLVSIPRATQHLRYSFLLPSPLQPTATNHGRRRISNPHRPLQWPWCHYSRLICICYLICPRSQFHRRHMQITVCYFSFFLYLYDILCISLCVLDDEPYNFCLTYIFWSVKPSIHHHHQFHPYNTHHIIYNNTAKLMHTSHML